MLEKPILVVPTYSYLSYPIIEKFAALKSREQKFVCLDFFQPRADFGLIPESDIFSERKKIYPNQKHLTLSGGRKLQQKLLAYLEEIDPELIFTFSDATFFSRCIKGTRFEELILVVQPCLLSTQAPGLLRKVSYRISSLINRVTGCPILREKHYWGEVLEHATYFVWGRVEKKTRKISGKVYECGDYFLESANSSYLSGSKNSALVIVPDLPYYTNEQFDSLTLSYARILNEFPDISFSFKYHPRNEMRLPLSEKDNYIEIPEFSVSDVCRYGIVLASYSNLTVLIRRIHEKVMVFDIGCYADFSNEYFSQEYFKIAHTEKELVEKFYELKSQDSSESASNTYHESFFPISPEFLTLIVKVFSQKPGLMRNDI